MEARRTRTNNTNVSLPRSSANSTSNGTNGSTSAAAPQQYPFGPQGSDLMPETMVISSAPLPANLVEDVAQPTCTTSAVGLIGSPRAQSGSLGSEQAHSLSPSPPPPGLPMRAHPELVAVNIAVDSTARRGQAVPAVGHRHQQHHRQQEQQPPQYGDQPPSPPTSMPRHVQVHSHQHFQCNPDLVAVLEVLTSEFTVPSQAWPKVRKISRNL